METIKYKDREITPIMKPMLVWNEKEEDAVEAFIYVKEDIKITNYPFRGWEGERGVWWWKNAKPLPKIEITVKINGKKAKLSDISEETLLKLRKI